MAQLFAMFDEVRIINLIDRSDRRQQMMDQMERLGGMPGNAAFYEAQRPSDPAGFPNLGARGCFESHLTLLRSAQSAGVESLLILEDDFDFTRSGLQRAREIFGALGQSDWSFFYGAHPLSPEGRVGLSAVPGHVPIQTTSSSPLGGPALAALTEFFEGILKRPAGSPDYGPMHVDGAYSVFRRLHPQFATFAAFPPLGHQRSSPSDITPANRLIDRYSATRGLARSLRSTYNWLARRRGRR
jgi:hypothetical protein